MFDVWRLILTLIMCSRDTWGNPNIPGVNTRLVFLIGATSDPSVQNEIYEESREFGDIIQELRLKIQLAGIFKL